MHVDPYSVLGSAVVGLLVGMTSACGGAVMTPMLILLFGILAFCALFIYLFSTVYGPLVYAILILGALAAIILLFGRR